MEDQAKRVACTRCRTQKLKCVRSTMAEVSSRCDRCRKANAECHYVMSRPVGRPRTCHSQRRRTTEPPSLKTAPCQTQQHHEEDYLNSLLETADTGPDSQDFDALFGGITLPASQSEPSINQERTPAANEVDLLTPPTDHGDYSFPIDFDSFLSTMETQSLRKGSEIKASGVSNTTRQDPVRCMQHLAELGIEFHYQIVKYQRRHDDEQAADLIGDVLRSSTDYLNTLLSLDTNSVCFESCGTETGGAGEQRGQTPPLDMPAAFQLLIPYVRLVQLHNILYETILCRMTEKNASSALCTAFPDIWVGGVCINTRGLFRARLLLQMNVHLLAEIETVLELPHEARICSVEAESSARGTIEKGMNEGSGFLRKAVSPRLLKMILDERDLVSADVQSMRERIAQIKRLLYSP